MPDQLGGIRAQNAAEIVQANSRETNIKRTTVVETGCDKGIDKGVCGSRPTGK